MGFGMQNIRPSKIKSHSLIANQIDFWPQDLVWSSSSLFNAKRSEESRQARGLLKENLRQLLLQKHKALPHSFLKWAQDKSFFSFPSPFASISHTKGHCWAVVLPQGDGVGIDVEKKRNLPADALRFYGSPWEISFHRTHLKTQAGRLKFWTLKEALFKSDLNNDGLRLSQYMVLQWPTKKQYGVGVTPSGQIKALHSAQLNNYNYALSYSLPGCI